MTEATTIVLGAWLIQAIAFGFIGDERRCGFLKAFFVALIAGPFAAMALVITSPPRPPMGK